MDLLGKMRQRVHFCLNQPNVQGAGFTDNYGQLLITRGYLRKSSGNRSLSFGEIDADSVYKLTIRYQQAVAVNLTISAKFVINNVWYTITSWRKFDEINQFYEFVLNKKEPVVVGSIDLSPIEMDGISPLYLGTVAGETTVNSLVLSGKTILTLARSGIIYNQVDGVPGNAQFSFSGDTITFGTPFNAQEIIYVLCKS